MVLMDFSDLLPTLCDAAGIDLPPSLETDGRSFLPQVCGRKGDPREWIYSYLYRGSHNERTIRNKRWKLSWDGKLMDMQKCPYIDPEPVVPGQETPEAKEARKNLQTLLDRLK